MSSLATRINDPEYHSDVVEERDSTAEEAAPLFISTKPFELSENIPPRGFLYKKLYIKGYVTGTAATGGTGKTTVVDVETVSMAIGKDLFDEKKPLRCGSMKILVLSLEDDEYEHQRRLAAIVRHYRLTDDEIALLKNIIVFFDSRGSLKVTDKEGNNQKINEEGVAVIKKEITDQSIDVVTIDPLISIHDSNENANEEMQVVIHALRDIARETDTAIHYLHHNRKGGGGSADDMRGGVSLRDGSRALRMLYRLSGEELEKIGIPKDDAPFVICEMNGKANFAALNRDITLYKTAGIPLNNGTDIFDGDFIGVAMKYKIPDLYDGITMKAIDDLQEKIKSLPPEERRADIRSHRWLGYVIMSGLDIDKIRAKQIIKDWEKSETLTTDTVAVKNGKNTEEKEVYVLDKTFKESLNETET